MLRRVFWIFIFYILIIFGANASNVHFANLNYKVKLAKLFISSVDSLPAKAEIMPAYILCNDSIKFQKDLPQGSYPVVDLQNGKNDRLRIPYPTADVMACVTDQNLLDSLFNSALLMECAKGAQGVLNKDEQGNRTLTVVADSMLHHKAYKVVDFPAELLKTVQKTDFERVKVKADGLKVWTEKDFGKVNFMNWKGAQSLSITFEELLDNGYLFYTDDFEKDYQKLIRAYEGLLFDSTRIDDKYALDTVGVHSKLVHLNIDSLEREQTKFRFNTFRKSIALYQKKIEIPIVNIDQLNGVVCDYREDNSGDFFTKALYYQPELKECDELADGLVDVSISLCDSKDKLIELNEHIKASDYRSSTIKILIVRGVDPNFYEPALLDIFDAILVAQPHYQVTWDMLAQALYGGFGYDGDNFNARALKDVGFWQTATSKIRLGFSYPECLGFNTDTLNEVNDIIEKAIRSKATPGVQMLIARKGEIVWQQSYGYYTYSKKKRVENNDLYDVASVTKLMATWPMVLDLYEKKKISLDDSLITYLPDLDTTDKKDITIKELLLHQSGLRSYIPFYSNAVDRESLHGKDLYSRRYSGTYSIKLDNWFYQNKYAKYRKDVFQNKPDSIFSIEVCDKMFMNYQYIDSMKAAVYASPLRKKKDYLYSDLGYHFLHMIMDHIMELSLDNYYNAYFARKLGANHTLYKPLTSFDKEQIVPTEKDESFRKELLQGYVHDQGAAMLGGVAANAGLFSNAGDLAKVAQMFLNKGSYGGVKFFQPETVDYFTSKIDPNSRRGLGVDKPELDPSKASPCSRYASPESFGHSGFTGTLVWIDPKYDLVFIFLSNRIHPNSYNTRLLKTNVRTNLQDVVYRSISE